MNEQTPPPSPEGESTAAPVTRCVRCKEMAPVDDDGFCERCSRQLEQACL